MNITELSIRRPVTTIMLFVSMVAIGLIASFRLPLEAEPEASIPFFFVSLPYAGSTPEEVERNLVRPVEEALATMPGIETMNSRANADGGSIQVRFSDWSRDIAIAASEARERIDAIRDQLPDDFRRYFVQRWSTSDREALSLRLTSQVDLTTRADLIERSIKQRLERIPGVARVEVEGVAKQEVLVALDKDRLTAHGVVLNELVQKLQAANFAVSAGQITEAGRRLRVQPMGELQRAAAVARPAPRHEGYPPLRHRRYRPQAAAHELRAPDGRQAQRRRGHLQGARRQPGRPVAARARGDQGAAKPTRRCAGMAIEVTDDQGAGRHQFAAGAGRGRRHRPAAVGARAVCLPAPLAVHADGDARRSRSASS